MTAIVGVINKRAVAIAADSAVTLGDTHKVLNTGNKLFTLSKYAPVGIGIYGTVSLMDTPWEVIIKHYRSILKDKNFNTLKEYSEDFISFLKSHEFFTPCECQKVHLKYQIQSFYDIVEKNAKKDPSFTTNPNKAVKDDLNDCLKSNKAYATVFKDFENYSLEDFKAFASAELEAVIKSKSYLTTQQDKDLFMESYFYYMRAPEIKRNNESGLVFFGYGNEEIYPCLFEVKVTIGFEGKLQYRYIESIEIKNDGTSAAIIPFAQTKVSQTIIKGINPDFYDILTNAFKNSMKSFRKQISDAIRTNPTLIALADGVDAIDPEPIATALKNKTIAEFNINYTNPLVNTITSLGKEDMANVAESFVSLTSLVRRMSPGEETVGGPVDVAVVSKGDGFIWIKRKHYFKPELNNHFFSNYYND